MALSHKADPDRHSKIKALRKAGPKPEIDRDLKMGNRSPKSRLLDRESFIAFTIYLGLSFFFFGRGLIGHFGDRYIGVGCDPTQQIDYVAWWPFAIAHHLNPFFNTLAWSPEPTNLATSPSIPLPAFLMAPITMLGGPIRSFNLLMLLSPALSAWCAFILFRRICGEFWPAIAGASLFGFSPFILGHLLSSIVALSGWFITLAIYLALLRLNEEISAAKFAALLSLVLIGQTGWSLETLATMTFFGAIALGLAWMMGGADLRRRITGLAAPIAAAYGAATLLASPYIYYFFSGAPLDLPRNIAVYISALPSNFVLPSQVNLLGAWTARWLSPRTPICDATAYIGIPAFFLVAIMAMRRSREFAVKMCVAMLIILATLSLGPVLLTGPHRGIVMPEALLYFFAPLFKNAMPARFAAFFFICIGALFALWLSDKTWSAQIRWGFGAIVLLSLAPNLNASFWLTNVDTPAFFRNGLYRKYISPDETIMILPYGTTGTSDVWQADARHFFRTAGGYLSLSPPVPEGYREWPAVPAIFGLYEIPDLRRNIAAFLVDKHVSKVIVADGGAHVLQTTFGDGPPIWRLRAFNPDEKAAIAAFFGWIDPGPLHVGGVTIYRIPLDRLSSYAQLAPQDLQLETERTLVRTLVTAANSYLAQGGDIANLNLVSAADRDLIPRPWLTNPTADGYLQQLNSRNGLTLKQTDDGLIEIRITGTAGALKQIAAEYQAVAVSTRILPPETAMNVADWVLPVLQMRFDRAGLAKAAQINPTRSSRQN